MISLKLFEQLFLSDSKSFFAKKISLLIKPVEDKGIVESEKQFDERTLIDRSLFKCMNILF